MSAVGKTAIQLYYWKVEFADHTGLAQFDDFGNEILIRNICPSKYLMADPVTHQNIIPADAKVFEDFEKIHGTVTKIGWYPYTKELAEKCTKKNPPLRIATNEDLGALELIVPENHYVGCPRNTSKVEFAVKYKKKNKILIPLESLQYMLGISLFSYDQRQAPIAREWLVNYH